MKIITTIIIITFIKMVKITNSTYFWYLPKTRIQLEIKRKRIPTYEGLYE